MLSELAFADTTGDIDTSGDIGPVEQRRLKRWQLVNYLRVFDANSGILVGHLVDLNQEGFMLLGTETLPCEQEFNLRMQRLSDGITAEIHLRAYSLWSKQDVDPHLFKTGFQLVHLDQEQMAFLHQLISELGKDLFTAPQQDGNLNESAANPGQDNAE